MIQFEIIYKQFHLKSVLNSKVKVIGFSNSDGLALLGLKLLYICTYSKQLIDLEYARVCFIFEINVYISFVLKLFLI